MIHLSRLILASVLPLSAFFSVTTVSIVNAQTPPTCVNGAETDPDGDGWGFENGVSCLVGSGNGNACSDISYAQLTTALEQALAQSCLLYTSPSPRDRTRSRMPSSA